MSGAGKSSKMMQLVNCRLRITLHDGRLMVGQLLAYDKHMNLVLTDCEEFRRTRSRPKPASSDADDPVEAATRTVSNELRRTLGMVILRGETIVSMVPEGGGSGPSAGTNKARIPASLQMAPGAVRAAMGRPGMVPQGMPMPMAGVPLSGPAPGMYVRPGMPMPPPGSMAGGPFYPPPPPPPS